MRLEVLISCMHQKDKSIIQRTNIQSDVLVINQCDENKEERFEFENKKGENCVARIIYTTERGLSRSRNMALRNATGDICLICDDDEVLEDNYVDKIIEGYRLYPKASVLAFTFVWIKKKDPKKPKRINYLSALRVNSIQITFKRDTISFNKVFFDEMLGSGTGHGGGEENKFLYDCLRNNLRIYYTPILIGRCIPNKSIWFKGFTNDYFYNRGFSNKRIMGTLFALLYALEYAIAKYPRYRKENSFLSVIYHQIRGVFSK